MATIKTAISIDEGVFNEVETMTKKLHISRSQFFSQAARYMIDRKKNKELLQKINAVYDCLQEGNDEKNQRNQERNYALKRIRNRWK